MARRILALLAVAATTAATAGTAPAAPAATNGSCRVLVTVDGLAYYGTVTRSSRTSCPFARNVTRASLRFVIHHGGVGDGDFWTAAWSPVTDRLYAVHCQADGNIYSSGGIHVDCNAGIGARVDYQGHAA